MAAMLDLIALIWSFADADRSKMVQYIVKSADVSVVKDIDDSALGDEFGEDIYAPFTKETPVRDDPAPIKDKEDSKIKCLIETPAYSQADKGYGPGRGRMMAGHGFGQAGLIIILLRKVMCVTDAASQGILFSTAQQTGIQITT